MAQTLEQPVLEIQNVETARPWVLKAYAGYIKGSASSSVTVDFRKIATFMQKRPNAFPIAIQEWEDGRIIGMILDEMCTRQLISVREWRCSSCGVVFERGLLVKDSKWLEVVTQVCPRCKSSAITGHNRSNGGLLYATSKCAPLRQIPGAVMVRVEQVEEPEIVVRDPGNIISLMASIQRNGLRVPLTCRRHGDKIQVVDGWRRLNAVRYLGLENVPCLIDTLTDREAYEVAGLSNMERLQMSPIEEGRFYDGYIKRGWGNVETISKKFSVPPERIRLRLELLINPETTRRAIEKGLIDQRMGQYTGSFIESAENAKERKQREGQVEELTRLIDEKEIALSTVPKLVDLMKEKKVGVERALELAREEAETKLRVKQEAQKEEMLVEYSGQPCQDFRCDCGCGSVMRVDWEQRKIFRLNV